MPRLSASLGPSTEYQHSDWRRIWTKDVTTLFEIYFVPSGYTTTTATPFVEQYSHWLLTVSAANENIASLFVLLLL